MPATRFELLYDSFVRREVVNDLNHEKRARINALFANAAYLQGGEEGLRGRQQEIEVLTEQFNDVVDQIVNPQPEVDLAANPFFAAGLRGMERAKWEYQAAQQVGVAEQQ